MIYKNYIQFDQDYGGGGGGSSTSINQFTGPAVTINDTNQSSNAEIPTSEIDISLQDTLSLDINSKTIDKTFGRNDDYIELHIYNNNNQLIYSEENFKDFTQENPLSSNIQIDPNKILTDRNFITGQFRIKLNILKNKIFNTESFPFIIKEISNNRREIKSTSPTTVNQTLDVAVNGFIADIEASSYFKEFSINLGNDVLIPCINILLNKGPLKHELLLKTLNTIPTGIQLKSEFKIVEEITDSIFINIDLGDPQLVGDGIPLRGPNYYIDIRQNKSVPSGFKSYNDLLSYNVTSSYQHLLSKIEDSGLKVDIQYDHIREVSESLKGIDIPYHFDNFVHFSSATERLKNFEYKLKLIETYDSQLTDISNITGNTANSSFVLTNKENINTKKENLIKGFDGYEQFLYFESGTFSWPKQNSTRPFTLYAVTSSQAKTWLGNDKSNYSNYGGQLLSASLFDKQNEYALEKLIPTHIKDNLDNSLYTTFINMIGQHFDSIWSYINAITKVKNTHHTRGISKDLVYYQLKSLGIESFDQFENSQLIEYILGEGSGSNQYDVDNFFSSSGIPSETIITASNAGSIPKQDIAKEVWKRLYHNAPYLLKTKGTERGIKALMSCYGIPSTILSIKEYGGSTPVSGPLKDLKTADFYKTFTYEKASLALKGNSGANGYFIKTNFSGNISAAALTTFGNNLAGSTIEFRAKPYRTNNTQILLTMSGSTLNGNYGSSRDHIVTLEPYTGNDISSSGDATQYGRLNLIVNTFTRCSTDFFPIYNGDFWNVNLSAKYLGNIDTGSLTIGARQANFNKNIFKYEASANVSASNFWSWTWQHKPGNNGFKFVYIGGLEPNTAGSDYDTFEAYQYSGSIQEVRYYIGEVLSDSTLKKHALEPFMYAGNSISSSYNNLVLRLPLGSNDLQDSSSFHPNIDVSSFGMEDGVSSSISSQQWEEIVETHFLPTPDTVGISTTSEKVRIDEGIIDENILSPSKKYETSTLDRQPPEYEDLGIFFSPTNEINEDIIYQLGSFRLDDYIGSPLPSAQTASQYNDLKTIKDIYFKRVTNKYNYGDYIKQIQYLDHTLFKVIEQFVPFKANTKTGLIVEPHFLERSKFKRTTPIRSDDQTTIPGTHQNIETSVNLGYYSGSIYSLEESNVISTNNLLFTTSSKGERLEQGTNGTIHIYDDHLEPFGKDPNRENNQASQAPIKPFESTKPSNYIAHESSILLGNAIGGRKSNKYYKYKEYILS